MRRLFAVALLTVLALLGGAPAALAETPTDIVVEDTAGVLDRNTLLPALEDIDFYEPTKVAVYTRNGSASDNFNEEVLAYARAEHPDWLSPDGQKWADGLYLFAFDPVGRQVGTYMGEDRKVSLEQREDIQESTYDLLRDAQWTDAAIAGVERGAELINRPWYRNPALYIAGGGVLAAGGISAGAVVLVRNNRQKKNREKLGEAEAAYASVTADLDATELNTHTIPADSPYGAKVLDRYRGFREQYAEATELGNQARAFSDKELKTTRATKVIDRYAETAGELDAVDDVIADTNTLLNRAPGWEAAWERQALPLREDLAELDEVFGQGLASGPTADALRRFRSRTQDRPGEWAQALAEGRMSPEQALDELRRAREELSALLQEHSEAAMEAYAKNKTELESMRSEMEKARRSGARYRRGYGILDAAYPATWYFTAPMYIQSYSAGVSSVESARSAASSGSSTGYGSSGGSFSGSGSSSRF